MFWNHLKQEYNSEGRYLSYYSPIQIINYTKAGKGNKMLDTLCLKRVKVIKDYGIMRST